MVRGKGLTKFGDIDLGDETQAKLRQRPVGRQNRLTAVVEPDKRA